MVTASHVLRKLIRENPFLLEGMSRGIISYGNLAEELKPAVEKELGKRVSEAALVMALRRYEEELVDVDKKLRKSSLTGEILMRTNIMDINVVKTNSLLAQLKELYTLVNFEKGDTLNIIQGSNEIAIIINEKYTDKLLRFLKKEKIIAHEKNLVALTINFDMKDFISTPGIIFRTVRGLAWEGINIFEIVSTFTELTFILHADDSMKAYSVLGELLRK